MQQKSSLKFNRNIRSKSLNTNIGSCANQMHFLNITAIFFSLNFSYLAKSEIERKERRRTPANVSRANLH